VVTQLYVAIICMIVGAFMFLRLHVRKVSFNGFFRASGILMIVSFFNLEGSWGYWSIAFFQQVASLGNNIAMYILLLEAFLRLVNHFNL
jgi:hypothetical protein